MSGRGLIQPKGELGQSRSEGDRYRDARDWPRAAAAYEKYLQLVPGDFDIWVQRGNCLKEDGEYQAARAAYDAAFALKTKDADLMLQYGHLYKMLGSNERAIDYYRKSLELEPEGPAFTELSLLGAQIEIRETGPEFDERTGPIVYLDITDVLLFLSGEFNLSGIQRVIANIFEATRKRNAQFDRKHICCLFDGAEGVVRVIPSAALTRVFEIIKTPNVTRALLNAALGACYGHRAVFFKKGDRFVILGAFWVSSSYPALLLPLRALGVRIGVLIYDLIPVTHKLFVEQISGRIFNMRVLQVLALSDFAMTISDYVAQNLKDFVHKELGREMPIRSVPLAHELAEPRGSTIGPFAQDLASHPFVLSVGTIEWRKNHIFLFKVWRELIAIYGEATPTLVLVGRWSWRVDDLRQALDETRYLDGKIVVLTGVSDAELTHFYRKCLCTYFPSLAEGWGLPVGESLAYGKACIASDATSIPEVGGALVRYIDPLDVVSGVAAIREYLDDPAQLELANARIEREFVVRTWANVTDDLAKAIEEGAEHSVIDCEPAYCALPTGCIVHLSAEAIERRAYKQLSATTFPLACVSGWHAMEEWGCWSSSCRSMLRFRVVGVVGATKLRVGLQLTLPGPDFSVVVQIRSDNLVTDLDLNGDRPRWLFFDALTDARGVASIEFFVKGHIPQPESTRRIYIGLSALAIAEEGNFRQRAAIMEQFATEKLVDC